MLACSICDVHAGVSEIHQQMVRGTRNMPDSRAKLLRLTSVTSFSTSIQTSSELWHLIQLLPQKEKLEQKKLWYWSKTGWGDFFKKTACNYFFYYYYSRVDWTRMTNYSALGHPLELVHYAWLFLLRGLLLATSLQTISAQSSSDNDVLPVSPLHLPWGFLWGETELC